MTEIQKLREERDAYKNLIIQQKVNELIPKIAQKGLTNVLAELVSMNMDTEVRAQAAEKELRDYKNKSIPIYIMGR